MRTRLQLPFASYDLRSLPASCARLDNCYIEALPEGAKTPVVLTRAPGIRQFETDAGTGSVRAMHNGLGELYSVIGTKLWKHNLDGSSNNLGTVTSGHADIAHNADKIVVVTEPDAFYYEPSTVNFFQILDADYTSRGAKYVRFCDNYLLFLEPNTARFFCADVGSATSFDALNFATAEGVPDDLIGMEVDHRQVLLFGTESVEIWENTGASGFPFERTINGFIEIGCFNGDTIAKIDNSVVWMASDYTVRRLSGTTPVRVSTHAIEQFLSTVDVTTGRAYSYSLDGHFFYVLCFASGCKVWDVTTDKWHDRSSYPEDYFRWQFHAQAHGREYVGDYYSNTIGYYDPEWYYEAVGTFIQRVSWTYQPIYAEHRLALHRSFEVVLETGVGITTGQGSDPEIMLSYSDDGGITWTNLPNRKIGRMGEYRTRVRWNGLGSSRMRVYRCAVSDPVRLSVTDTIVEVEGGRL